MKLIKAVALSTVHVYKPEWSPATLQEELQVKELASGPAASCWGFKPHTRYFSEDFLKLAQT